VGWFVGYLEAKGNVYIFATNIGSPDSDGDGRKAKEITGNKAKEITRNILQGLGLLQ
jgi:beta-lactamase class D